MCPSLLWHWLLLLCGFCLQMALGLGGNVDERWDEAVRHMKNMELRLLPTNQVPVLMMMTTRTAMARDEQDSCCAVLCCGCGVQTDDLLRCVRAIERAYHAAGCEPSPPGAL